MPYITEWPIPSRPNTYLQTFFHLHCVQLSDDSTQFVPKHVSIYTR